MATRSACVHDHHGSDAPILLHEQAANGIDQRQRVAVNRNRRQAVGDHECQIRHGAGDKALRDGSVEFPAQVRPGEIGIAIRHRAGNANGIPFPRAASSAARAAASKRRMYRIPGTGVSKLEVELRGCRHSRAGPRQADARRSVAAQFSPAGKLMFLRKPAHEDSSSAPNRAGRLCGRMLPSLSSNPMAASQASNSGAARRFKSCRTANRSWNDVLW